jgi:pimeloyl-ACP methyl ester carboxylesterase
MDHQRFVVNGRELHVRAWGSGGPSVMLLHGITDSGLRYENFGTSLAARYRVIAPDFRGHGWSSRASSYRVPDYLSDICALAVAARIHEEPWVCYGHSLGGLVAIALACQLSVPSIDPVAGLAHEQVSENLVGIVAEDPPLFEAAPQHPHPASVYSDMRLQQNLRAHARDHAEFLESLIQAYPDLSVANHYRRAERLWRCDPLIWDPLFAGNLSDSLDLSAITFPTVILRGDPKHGSIIQDDVMEECLDRAPQLQHHYFSGCGHGFVGEQAERIQALIAELFV